MHAPLWGPPRVDPEFDEYRRREGRKAYVRARVRSVLRAGNGAPPEGSWIDGPDCPAPSEDELDSLKDPKARPAEPNQKLSVEEAFGLAARALENVKTLHATCVDPEKMQSYARLALPFMIFDDLDSKLFRSVLKGNVYLSWARLPAGMDARTSRPGFHGRPRISIQINRSMAKPTRIYLIGLLLHHMIQ